MASCIAPMGDPLQGGIREEHSLSEIERGALFEAFVRLANAIMETEEIASSVIQTGA